MQIHKNSFDGGLNTNIVKNLLPPNKYIEANNVNIASDGNFFALENIKGTTSLVTLPEGGYNVLAVFKANFRINSTSDIPGLVIITTSSFISELDYFKIWAFDSTSNSVYRMYTGLVPTSYAVGNPVIDGVVYPENGLDILYFTDNVYGIKKLICDVPDSLVQDFLDERDLALVRPGAIAPIDFTVTAGDGSLFCGSYQFAYQLCNPSTNQFTKFSLLSNPCQIYTSTDDLITSGVGVNSNRGIYLTVRPLADELDYYTHFRLAVLEHIYPLGEEPEITSKAQLTQLYAVADYVSAGTLLNIPYLSNSRVETIDVAELVVDQLALQTVKTLAIKTNRLLGGNITYKDLSYDNGDPVIGGGTILKQTGEGAYDNLFSNENMASKYRGYFRDEVYRYAISYFDGDGNFSFPKVLDMSSITHNQITGSYKDMKFPARSQNFAGTTYTLFDSAEGIQTLGLQLTGIDNHPTWAKGFVILRAERIKNILFQTPIIPTEYSYTVGAVEKYPYEALELSGATTKVVSYDTAQPMGPFYTWMPRNYFHLPSRRITRNPTLANAGTVNAQFIGEATYSSATGASSYPVMVFPPDFMYADQPVLFNQTYSLQTVDAALCKGKYTNFSVYGEGVSTAGLNIKTSYSATFHALTDDQYYYDSAHGGAKATIGDTRTLKSFEPFNNLDQPSITSGMSLFNHSEFVTDGLNWGQGGAVQKCGVFILDDSLSEINANSALVFAAGSQLAHSAATYAFYTTNDTLVHTIEIANVVANLPDERYGPYDSPHNFISTGAIYVFDSIELSDVEDGTTLPVDIDVWGGDCYTVPHLFKITDTVYGITNPNKYGGIGGDATNLVTVQNWERAFNDDSANQAAVGVPVPFKNAAQFVEIVLESEYNPSIMDVELINVIDTEGSSTEPIPVYGIDTFESACRVPLTYHINHNHKKENNDKIFSIKDPLLSANTDLGARIIYSDQKVYQTSITGFDTFRVLNISDLEETYGDINKLITVGDDLYAIQESAVSYIGLGERTLETTDGLTLAIQSGSFIGTIIPIDTQRGTQHLRSVLNTGQAIYFVDAHNRGIIRLSGRQVQLISEQEIATTLRTILGSPLLEKNIMSIYDPVRKQCWFINNSATNTFCYVFDEARNLWVTNYQFPSGTVVGGAHTNDVLYLMGKVGSPTSVYSMYTGDRTVLMGTTVTPNVKFVVNPNPDMGKVFDDLLVTASDRLSDFDFTVTRETLLGSQTASGTTLDISSRGEGNFRAKILRDSAGARLRGLYGIGNLKWQSGVGEAAVYLPSVLTKYRISENHF